MWPQQLQTTEQVPLINTLTQLINTMVNEGYTDSFKVTARGLYSCAKSRYYRPEQVSIINFYRSEEGQSDPGANTTMYVIETSDGVRGTLIDGYGNLSDDSVEKFIAEVEDIRKKVVQHEC